VPAGLFQTGTGELRRAVQLVRGEEQLGPEEAPGLVAPVAGRRRPRRAESGELGIEGPVHVGEAGAGVVQGGGRAVVTGGGHCRRRLGQELTGGFQVTVRHDVQHEL
jgi:hypothetical protein